MSNVGGESYEYDSFESLQNSDELIQNIVDDYNQYGIFLNKEESVETTDSKPSEKRSKARVKNAAKRATNKAMKSTDI